MKPEKIILHRDFTLTYWSVYDQTWHRRVQWLSDREIAARPPEQRMRIERHLAKQVTET